MIATFRGNFVHYQTKAVPTPITDKICVDMIVQLSKSIGCQGFEFGNQRLVTTVHQAFEFRI